jgi:FKBP-type peptidyl-prolyl cis-trans isomerase FklB
MKFAVTTFLTIGVALSTWAADSKTELKNQRDKSSYAIGLNMGKNIRLQGADINLDLLSLGLKDGVGATTPLLTDEQMKEVMGLFQTELRSKQEAKRKEQGEKNKNDSEAFLAENKKKADIVTLPSGLQYKILTTGKGVKPVLTDKVSVKYRGTLINGTEFDSTEKNGGKPAEFGVGGVVKGWTEALQLMTTGSKWQLFIPSELGYGERGSRNIEPNSALIFEVELLEILKAAEAAQPITSDIIKVPSADELKKGAKIEVIKPDQLPNQTVKPK